MFSTFRERSVNGGDPVACRGTDCPLQSVVFKNKSTTVTDASHNAPYRVTFAFAPQLHRATTPRRRFRLLLRRLRPRSPGSAAGLGFRLAVERQLAMNLPAPCWERGLTRI